MSGNVRDISNVLAKPVKVHTLFMNFMLDASLSAPALKYNSVFWFNSKRMHYYIWFIFIYNFKL